MFVGLILLSSPLIAAKQPVLSFCYEEWQPYAYVDQQGDHQGLSIDLIWQKLNAANLDYQFHQLPFPRCQLEVLSGHIDFIMYVDDTDSEFHLLSFPISYWQLTFAVAQENSMDFNELTASQGMKIIIARSYNYPGVLEKKLKQMSAQTVRVSYYTGELVALKRLFHRLTVGQGQAMVVDKVWAQQIVKKYQLPIRVFDQVLVSVPQYIGFKEGNIERAILVEQALTADN